ncbi:unnamed protein product [Diatraea saccharalis]|uniref:Uncharacterized protein n=1 Tax=Diatraea saccharalis TaxID=40085 RepID=A0A9N9R6T9_9NEOP|nr:unnamed protein product [Diatraea saccharalis]
MVEFMEKNGDLSKPSGGPRGRHFIQLKWKELTQKLNSEGTGDFHSEEKWRKTEVHTPDIPTENEYETILEETTEEHWNTPGTSSQPTVHPITATNDIGLPTIDDADEWQPPAPKRNKKDSLAKLFIESDRNARQYARERDLAYEKLEKERIELHDYEIVKGYPMQSLEIEDNDINFSINENNSVSNIRMLELANIRRDDILTQ